MKENEWIVSPKKLRENQKKAIERDKRLAELKEIEEQERKEETTAKIIIAVVATIVAIAMIQLFAIKTTTETETQIKTCNGQILQVCVTQNK